MMPLPSLSEPEPPADVVDDANTLVPFVPALVVPLVVPPLAERMRAAYLRALNGERPPWEVKVPLHRSRRRG